MFVRNCWYMAGWSRDFTEEKPVAATILGESIVIYRTANGTAVALRDRCAHRFAPLSMGRVEGNDLRCMYHGLKFAPTGKCIEVPGQQKIPPQACVRAYPIVDKYSGAWVWMGDSAKADESLIPNFVGIDDPAWVMPCAMMRITERSTQDGDTGHGELRFCAPTIFPKNEMRRPCRL